MVRTPVAENAMPFVDTMTAAISVAPVSAVTRVPVAPEVACVTTAPIACVSPVKSVDGIVHVYVGSQCPTAMQCTLRALVGLTHHDVLTPPSEVDDTVRATETLAAVCFSTSVRSATIHV